MRHVLQPQSVRRRASARKSFLDQREVKSRVIFIVEHFPIRVRSSGQVGRLAAPARRRRESRCSPPPFHGFQKMPGCRLSPVRRPALPPTGSSSRSASGTGSAPESLVCTTRFPPSSSRLRSLPFCPESLHTAAYGLQFGNGRPFHLDLAAKSVLNVISFHRN